MLFLRRLALLTLTLTNPNCSPDADLDRNSILDPVFNIYPDFNWTRRTRRILPTPQPVRYANACRTASGALPLLYATADVSTIARALDSKS